MFVESSYEVTGLRKFSMAASWLVASDARNDSVAGSFVVISSRMVALSMLVVVISRESMLADGSRVSGSGSEISSTFLSVDFLVFFCAASFRDFLASRVVSPSIDLLSFIVYNYIIMSVKLTKKQLAVLNFLQDFVEENGYTPSYREIMTGLELSSVSAVAEHIDNLVAKGVLKKNPGAARSLEILDYKHEETVELFKVRMMSATEEEKKILLAAAELLGLDLE